MSRTIDEKVVEMRFDNQDFEKNVSQSMSTLDKLKSALDFSGVDKTFSGLTDAANKLNLGGVGDAIEDVGSKFSWLETIATGALLNIGASIESKLVDTLKSVTVDQLGAGFSKYESKTKAVQTILAAVQDTGMGIEEVSAQLERLNWYTDETSYSFEDMVNNISKFTSNGIELEKAVTAMEGISNWAAISGQGKNEAGRAMYNLSQALSAGAVMVKDWMSIENANMATKEFKEMAIQAALARGELAKFYDEDAGEEFYATYAFDELGNKIALTEVDYKSFRETLKEKWFSDEVLVDVLNTYGEFTDKLSEAYEDVNSLEGVYVSTTQLIKFSEAYVDGTLNMQDAIDATGKTAEELQVIFAELGKEEYELGRRAFLAAREARTFTDAIDATKDAVSTQLMNSFELIFGNYEEAKIIWTELADELAEIFAGPLSDINDTLSKWRRLPTGGRDDLIQGIKDIYHALRSIVDPISEAWEAIFPPLTHQRLGEIVTGFKNFTESMILSEDQANAVSHAFEGIFGVIKVVVDAVKELGGTYFSNAFGGLDGFTDGIFQNVKKIGDYLDNVLHVIPRMKSAREAFEQGQYEALGYIQKWEKTEAIVQKIADAFEKLKESAETLGTLASKFLDLNGAINTFYNEGGGIAGVLEVVVQRISNVASAIEELVHIWTGIDISGWIDPIVKTLFEFQEVVKGVQQQGWFTKIKDDFVGIGTTFRDTFGGFKEFFGPVFEALSAIAEDWIKSFTSILGDGTGSLEDFFKTMDDGLISIQNFIKTNETLKSIMDGIKDAIKIISDFATQFLSISQVIDVYREAGGGLAGVFAVINDKIGVVLDLVGTLVKRFTGLDFTGVKDGILVVISAIEEGFIRLADRIAQLFGWKDNPFHALLENSESSFGKLQEMFQKFAHIDTSGFSGLSEKLKEAFGPIGELLGGFGKFLAGVWSVVQALIPLIGQAFGYLGDILANFGERLKGMSFKDILDIVKTILILVKIKRIMDTIGGLGDVFDSLSDALKAWQTKLRAEALTAIGTAILMIAGALVVISMIPTDALIKSLAAVVVVLVALTGAIAIISAGLSKLFSASSIANIKAVTSFSAVLLAFGKAMLDVAVSTGILVIAIKALAGTQGVWMTLGQIGAALLGISVILFGLARLTPTGRLTEASTAILMISGALGALAIVIKMYDNIDNFAASLGKLAAAFGAIAGITVLMIALIDFFSFLSSNTTKILDVGGGLLALAAGLGVFVLTLKVLGTIPFAEFAVSLLKMIFAFVTFASIAALLNKFASPIDHFAETLQKLGKAILFLGAGIAIFGIIGKVLGDSAKEIADAGVDLLVTVLDAIVARTDEIAEDILLFIIGVLRKVAEHIPEIVELIVEIIGGIMKGVQDALAAGNITGGELAAGGGILAGIIAMILGVGKLTDAKSILKAFGDFELLLAAVMVVITELVAFFYGLGKLSELVGGTEALEEFGKFADALSGIIFSNFGALFGSIMGIIAIIAKFLPEKADLGEMSKELWQAFALFGELVAASTAIIVELGALFTIFGKLGELTHAVKNITYFGLIAETLAKFIWGPLGIMLGSIGVIIALLSALKISLDPGSVAAAAGTVIEVVGAAGLVIEALGALFALLGVATKGLDQILGYVGMDTVSAIEKFGDVCEAFFNVLGRIVGGLVGGVIEGIEKGKIKGMLEGFADGLLYFSQTTQPFFDMIESLGEGTMAAAEAFVDMILKLTAAEFLDAINIFGSDNAYEKMGDKIAKLGENVSKFVDATKDLNVADVAKAEACARIVTALAEGVPPTGGVVQWIMGEKDIGTFGDRLTRLGEGLMNFQNSTLGLKEETIQAAADVTQIVIEMSRDIPVQYGLMQLLLGTNDMGVFGSRLAALGTGLMSFQYSTEGLKQDTIEKASIAVKTVCAMAEQVPNQGSWFLDTFFGDKSLDTFGENLKSFGESFKNYGESIKDVDTSLVERSSKAIYGLIQVASLVTTLSEGVNDAKLNLGDIETFGKKIKSLGGSLKDYYKDIKDIKTAQIGNITGELKKMIDDFGKLDLKNSFFDLFESFKSGMTEAFDNQNGIINKVKGYITTISGIPTDPFYDRLIYSAGTTIATTINKGFKDITEMATTFQTEVIDRIYTLATSDENIELINKAGRQLLAAFGDGFTNSSFTATWQKAFNEYLDSIAALITDEVRLQQVRNAGSMFGQAIVEGLVSVDLTPAISQITTTISNGISGIDVSGAVSKVGTNINTALNNIDVSEASKNVGNNISAGVAQGMTSNDALSKVDKAAETVITRAEKTTEAKAQVASPSRLFAVIGRFLDEGLAMGIFEGIPDVQNAMASVITAISGGVSGESLISLLKGSGFSISDVFASSIMDASSDIEDYGGMVTEMFGDGMFNNLTSTMGSDFLDEIMSGMGANMPNVTAVVDEYGIEIGDSWYDGATEMFNPETGEELQNDVLAGMGDALPAVSESCYEYGGVAGEAWKEGYDDSMLSTADYYSDMTIQGPTVTFVADMSQVEEAIDDLVYYYGQSFQKNGELDGYLLAFDLADKEAQNAMIKQAMYEWGNEELANALILRQMNAANAAARDMSLSSMGATIEADKASVTLEEETITRDDFIRETNGLREDINGMREDIHGLKESWANADVYLDSGELVGVMAPRLDQEFGNLKKLGERGI